VPPQIGATTVPMSRLRDCAFSASFLISSSDESMLICGSNKNKSNPSNLMPSTSAAAVRLSIVSRSMNGSASGAPLPTTPGQAALWSFGNVFVLCVAMEKGLRWKEGEKEHHDTKNGTEMIFFSQGNTKISRKCTSMYFRTFPGKKTNLAPFTVIIPLRKASVNHFSRDAKFNLGKIEQRHFDPLSTSRQAPGEISQNVKAFISSLYGKCDFSLRCAEPVPKNEVVEMTP